MSERLMVDGKHATSWAGEWLSRVVLMLASLLLIPSMVAAQSATAAVAYPLPVEVARCEQMPSGGQSFPPPGCTALAGVTVRATTGDNRPVGSCVTGQDGTCQIPVKYDSMVIMAEDVAGVPAGYQPLANPLMTWVYTEFAGASFSNVRADLVPASPTAGAARLTIHSRVCPAGYGGPSYFETCHGTVPNYKQWFFLRRGRQARSAQIGADGNVVFPGLQPGEIHVQPGLPEATERIVLFCSEAATPGVEYPSTVRHSPYEPANSYTALLTLKPDASILCDLFAIPKDGA